MRTGFILCRSPNSPRSSHQAWESLEKWVISSGLTLEWLERAAWEDVCRGADARFRVYARDRASVGAESRVARERNIRDTPHKDEDRDCVMRVPEQSYVCAQMGNVDGSERVGEKS